MRGSPISAGEQSLDHSAESLKADYNTAVPAARVLLDELDAAFASLRNFAGVLKVATHLKPFDAYKASLQNSAGTNVQPSDLVSVRIVVRATKDIPAVIKFIESEFQVVSKAVYQFLSERIVSISASNLNRRSTLPGLRNNSFLIEVQSEPVEVLALYFRHFLKRPAPPRVAASALPRVLKKPPPFADGLTRIENVIYTFQQLIERENVREKQDIHAFLNQHSFLLHTTAERVLSEVPFGLGTQMRADFLVQEASGKYVLFELENPQQPLLTQRGEISAAVNHAVQQVEDWQEWIEQNLATVQRTYPGIISPRGIVVIGRSKHLSADGLSKIARRNLSLRPKIEILTYDDLVKSAWAFLDTVRRCLSQTKMVP